MKRFRLIHADPYATPVKPTSIGSGACKTSHFLKIFGRLFLFTRDGLTSTRPGFNKVMVVSMCVDAYRFLQGWTLNFFPSKFWSHKAPNSFPVSETR